ncbi:MAG: hypothetical protein AB7I37_25300 [Pirellulales bacterium]
MASLVSVRPGVHTATWNAVGLGITTGEGFKLKFRPARIPINNTNLYGDCLIDGIHKGAGMVQLLATFKEWNAAVQAAIWPWGAASPPTLDGTIGTIGKLLTDYAKPLILTAQAGSPAAAASAGGVSTANTFTAGMAVLAPENDVEMLFGAVETDVAVLFDLYLYDDSGTKRFFKWSSV